MSSGERGAINAATCFNTRLFGACAVMRVRVCLVVPKQMLPTLRCSVWESGENRATADVTVFFHVLPPGCCCCNGVWEDSPMMSWPSLKICRCGCCCCCCCLLQGCLSERCGNSAVVDVMTFFDVSIGGYLSNRCTEFKIFFGIYFWICWHFLWGVGHPMGQ